jgi:hypothetical protein
MKTKLFSLLIIALVLSACSSDNNSSDNSNSTSYFPLNNNNYWVYKYDSTLTTGRDSIYVSGDTIISTITHKKIKSLAQPMGFFSNSLRNNGIRMDNGSLMLNGATGMDFGGNVPLSFPLNDFVIFKESAVPNAVLSTISGTINQDFQGYPLTINYVLTSKALESLPNFTAPDGTVYNDIKKVKTTLNLKISTTVTVPNIPIPIALTVLGQQDVLVATHYYAKNIGMVYTHTDINYQLEDFSQFSSQPLPFPSSGSDSQNEVLDTYIAN